MKERKKEIFLHEKLFELIIGRECEMRDGSFSVPVCEEEWIEGVIKKTWGWLRCNSQEEINGEDKLELWAWWYLARFYSMIDDLNNERDDEISLRNSWKETRYFLVRFEMNKNRYHLDYAFWFVEKRSEDKTRNLLARVRGRAKRDRSSVTIIDIYKWSLHFHPRLWQSVPTLWNLLWD